VDGTRSGCGEKSKNGGYSMKENGERRKFGWKEKITKKE
jgi:hypothetical protein